MIRTEYTRQVPIKHWLPIPVAANERTERVAAGSGTFSPMRLKEEITGYKLQRAWLVDHPETVELPLQICRSFKDALLSGEEVDGFVWLDESVKE